MRYTYYTLEAEVYLYYTKCKWLYDYSFKNILLLCVLLIDKIVAKNKDILILPNWQFD